MSKSLFILLILSGLCCSAQSNQARQKSKIIGIVKLINSNNKPLEDVHISAPGSNGDDTDSDGRFTLEFQSLQIGDAIQQIQVTLEGYVLVNEHVTRQVVIPRIPESVELSIIMEKKTDNDKRIASLSQTVSNSRNEAIEKMLGDLQTAMNQLKENDAERKILLEKIQMLEEEKLSASRSENIASKLVSVDLDQASKIANDAYKALDDKSIDEAISILEDKVLDHNLEQAKNERLLADNRSNKAREALDQSIQNFMIKARLCISKLDYKEADKNFSRAVAEDLNNFVNLEEYVSFLNGQKLYTKGLKLINEALPLYEDDNIDRAYLLHLRGIFNQGLAKPDEALIDYQSAVELYEEDSYYYADQLALLYLYIGTIYHEKSMNELSMEYYNLGLEKYNELRNETLGDDYASGIADAKGVRGLLHQNMYNYELAIEDISDALKTYEELHKTFPDFELYEERVAYSLSGLCGVYRSAGKADTAVFFGVRAVDSYQKLTDKNAAKYNAGLGTAYYSLGLAYSDEFDLEKAEFNINKALETYNAIDTNNPADILNKASAYNILGDFYLDFYNDLEKCDSFYNISHEHYEKLYQLNKELYADDLISSYLDVGYFHQEKFEDPEVALQYCNLALHTCNELTDQDQTFKTLQTIDAYHMLGAYYLDLKDYVQSEENYTKEMELALTLPDKNPRYQQFLASSYSSLASLYFNKKLYEKSLTFGKSSLKIYKFLLSTFPQNDGYLFSIGSVYENMALAYNKYESSYKYDSVEYYFNNAISIKKNLADKNPIGYNVGYCHVLINQGTIYSGLREYTKEENLYLLAESRLKPSYTKDKRSLVDEEYCRLQYNMAVLYYNKLKEEPQEINIQKCESSIEQGKEIYSKYPKAHPIRKWEKDFEWYEKKLKTSPREWIFADRIHNRGIDLYNQKKHDDAVFHYLKSIELYETLINKIDSPNYKIDLSFAYYNLALAEKNESRKIRYIDKCISLRKEVLAGIHTFNKGKVEDYLATAFYRKGVITYARDSLLEACISSYEEAIKLYELLLKDSSSNKLRDALANCYITLSGKYKDHTKVIECIQKTISLRETISKDTAEEFQGNKAALATAYGNMSYHLLFVKRFNEVEDYVNKGLNLDSTQLWMKTNLAHALLFMDRYKEARNLYLALSNEILDNKKMKEYLIEDFKNLESEGITHPKIPEIRKLLESN